MCKAKEKKKVICSLHFTEYKPTYFLVFVAVVVGTQWLAVWSTAFHRPRKMWSVLCGTVFLFLCNSFWKTVNFRNKIRYIIKKTCKKRYIRFSAATLYKVPCFYNMEFHYSDLCMPTDHLMPGK